MARRSKWTPNIQIHFEKVSDARFAKILADLGDLFYKEICSCQLKNQSDPSIATRSEQSHLSERKVAIG